MIFNQDIRFLTQTLRKKEKPAGENVVESKDLAKQDIVEQKVFAVKKVIGTKAMDATEPLEA